MIKMQRTNNPEINWQNTYKLPNNAEGTNVRKLYDSLTDEEKNLLFTQILSEKSIVSTINNPKAEVDVIEADGTKSSTLELHELEINAPLLKEVASREILHRIASLSKGQLVADLENTLKVINEHFSKIENPVKDVKIITDPKDSGFKTIEVTVEAGEIFDTYDEAIEAEAKLGRKIDQEVEFDRREDVAIVPLIDGVDDLPLLEDHEG